MKKTQIKPSKIMKLAEKALKSAVAKVIEEHRQKKLPLVVWRNGRIMKVSANQI